jgi:hypothetical protein
MFTQALVSLYSTRRREAIGNYMEFIQSQPLRCKIDLGTVTGMVRQPEQQATGTLLTMRFVCHSVIIQLVFFCRGLGRVLPTS